jgi:hypothetical protein
MIGCDIHDLSISSTSRNMRWIHIAKPIHWPKGLRETDIINEGSSFDLEATPVRCGVMGRCFRSKIEDWAQS